MAPSTQREMTIEHILNPTPASNTTSTMQNNTTTTNQTTATLQPSHLPIDYNTLTVAELLQLLSARQIRPSFQDALIMTLRIDDENHDNAVNGIMPVAGSLHYDLAVAAGLPVGPPQGTQARQVSPDLDAKVEVYDVGDDTDEDEVMDSEQMEHSVCYSCV